jgi:hypothetical protein
VKGFQKANIFSEIIAGSCISKSIHSPAYSFSTFSYHLLQRGITHNASLIRIVRLARFVAIIVGYAHSNFGPDSELTYNVDAWATTGFVHHEEEVLSNVRSEFLRRTPIGFCKCLDAGFRWSEDGDRGFSMKKLMIVITFPELMRVSVVWMRPRVFMSRRKQDGSVSDKKTQNTTNCPVYACTTELTTLLTTFICD